MDSRSRLAETLSFSTACAPPRYESEFSEEVARAWRAQGVLDHRTPEEFLGLDPRRSLGIVWRRVGADKAPLECEADLKSFRRAYVPECPERVPEGFEESLKTWQSRDSALYVAPWNEGFLQVIGISDGESLVRALAALCERPAAANAAMEHYAAYLETLLDAVLSHVVVDYSVFYEPIASNHAPVLSPAAYAKFVIPALRRVVACLEKHGVRFRFIWSAGDVRPLVPLWLEAGINGLCLNQARLAGITYADLRRDYGEDLLLFGGVDWRAVVEGPEAVDRYLEREVRPVLEAGGYVPYLDDTVRAYMPFDNFQYYRRRLDSLVGEVFA